MIWVTIIIYYIYIYVCDEADIDTLVKFVIYPTTPLSSPWTDIYKWFVNPIIVPFVMVLSILIYK